MDKLSSQPLISALLVNKNHGAYIENAIESVLEQSYQNIELIIGDGCSTDGTLNILQKYQDDPRVSWFSEPDQNVFDGQNKLLDRAKGGIVGLISSTDTYLAGAFEQAVKEFLNDPYLVMIGGSVKHILDDGSDAGKVNQLCTEPVTLSVEQIVSFIHPFVQSAFFRRDLLEAVGRCDINLETCSSHYFLNYLLYAYQLGGHARMVPDYWGTWRLHPNPTHQNFQGMCFAKRRLSVCREYSDQYRSFLSRKQRYILLKSGYHRELLTRVRKLRQFFRAIPSATKYIWFGGSPIDVAVMIYQNLVRQGRLARLVGRILRKSRNVY